MKHGLRASRETLQRLWEDGLSGWQLLDKHSEAIDVFLQDRFAELTEGSGEMALVALGGYGRRELFPFSDIDLMLLHSRLVKKKVLVETAETILYPLWDAGLEVGHSVRSVSQCLTDCKNDFHLQIAMLDARLITGSEPLFDKLATSYKKKFIEGCRRDFLTKMAVERENRKRLYGGHSFQLEPNIKEGRGGFRDIQSMLWSARGVFGLKGLSAIEEAGVFRREERAALEDSFDNLVMIRNRLHYLSGRKNDQLFFEHQEGIAKALGYKDTRGMLGVEIFLQEVYGYLDTIAVATDLFFEHIDETFGATRQVKGDVVLDKGLAAVNGWIQLTDPELLARKPILLFKIFSQAARTGLPIHFRTRQLISGSLGLIDDDFRNSRRVAAEFFAILGAATPLALLSTMLETGLLSAYLPEFASLESLAQHDVFHVNTVDRHLLQTVGELQRLTDEQARIFSEITTPHVLNLAGLLHDIGKGRGGNHGEVGAEIAGRIGKRLGLNGNDLDELQFLVHRHLYLSDIAQSRDLEDEEVIFQCAQLIKDPNRLRMLYMLSIGDARATGPKVWSEWKGALLQDLYLRIAHALDQSEWVDPDRQQASQWMRDHVADALPEGSGDWLENLPDDYLLNYSVDEVVEHIGLKEKLLERSALLVPTDHGDHWSVLVVSRDRTGLLSRICGILALNNLSVLSAKIHTWQDGTVVDLIEVKPVFSNNFHEQDWPALTKDLNQVLASRLGLTHRLAAKKTAKRSGPALEHQRYATTVKIDNKSSRFFTIIEVFSEDQPSLLYDITRTMADFEINIAKALISTRQGQLIDVFYVLDSNGAKVTDSRSLEEIKQALVFAAAHSGF
ncbi:MAG: [protein-PII] uridylyltransferase [Thermodesulfobacteriota bacterium]